MAIGTTLLIPRDALFGSAQSDQARISPDGTMLSYLAPHHGKLSVWVRPRGGGDARMIAHDPARPIPWHAWQGDGRHVLYLQDSGGNENYHLFRVGLDGAAPTDLTPGERVRCLPLAIDHRHPDQALVTINERNPALFDVARVDFRTGTRALVAENPGDVIKWLADHDQVVRGALAQNADGESIVRVRDDGTLAWRELDHIAAQDSIPQLVAFSSDNRSLYVTSAKDANAARLVRYDLEDGSVHALLDDGAYDVHSHYVDPASQALVAASVLRDRVEWNVLTPEFGPTFAALARVESGDFEIVDATADGEVLVVRYTPDAGPAHFYLFDRPSGEATHLFADRPALLAYRLAPMQPIRVTARDGLGLHGYLTLPVDLEPKNLPTVLVVHGGPWYRDRWGFDPWIQWLANRGYAVLQVNFRGSTGYGKAFVNAGNREWAGAMRTDLLDTRDWAIARGIADPSRIGIFGGSYGGYAVLTALAFTPDAFACGVDLVGPSNLNTLLASVPPYWKPVITVFHRRMGEDPAFLDAQSPLFKADRIAAPLLIAQGANDPRVKRAESDQIVAAMRGNGIPVTYILFENEGHGFTNPQNNKIFMALAETFLAEHLGGRLEPLHADEAYEAYLVS
jgi:dipeptidyl aminopeptidase/acylaminoacyl peptidase